MAIPKRFRPAFWFATAASAAAVALAIGPNLTGKYDGTLAVLTATLIAIIWYTFFTYWAANRAEPSLVVVNVEGSPDRTLAFLVHNVTRERRIAVRVEAHFWRDGKPVELPYVLTGDPDEVIMLRPGEEHQTLMSVEAPHGVAGSKYGWRVQIGEKPTALIGVTAHWKDDLGESGREGPDYWEFEITSGRVVRVHNTAELDYLKREIAPRADA